MMQALAIDRTIYNTSHISVGTFAVYLETVWVFQIALIRAKYLYKFNVLFIFVLLGTIPTNTVLSQTGQAFVYWLIIYKYLIPMGSFIRISKN
jgi:hypothetical protein